MADKHSPVFRPKDGLAKFSYFSSPEFANKRSSIFRPRNKFYSLYYRVIFSGDFGRLQHFALA